MSASLLARLGVLALAALAVAAFALWRRHTDGRARGVRAENVISAAELGAPLGERLTLVQFSSPTCGPCVVARRHLSAAARTDGVTHIDLDVTEHPELSQRMHVLRTPTTLCLDSTGRVTARITGVPHPRELATLVDPTVEHAQASHTQEVAA